MSKKTKLPTKRKKKPAEKKIHRVYCTYFPDGRYYIGYSCKTEKQYEKYFGSSRIVKEYTESSDNPLEKETIVTHTTRNKAKLQELLLQLQCMRDPLCLNDMLHIRLRVTHLKDFEPVRWSPRHDTSTYIDKYIRD